jgi:hypothetical protein
MDPALKELLKSTVREWVRVDNEINTLNKEISARRETKKDMSGIYMFDFNGGQLLYVKKSKKKPITQKQLMTVLSTYLGDETKAEEMHKYIMDSREEVVEEKICRRE